MRFYGTKLLSKNFKKNKAGSFNEVKEKGEKMSSSSWSLQFVQKLQINKVKIEATKVV